MQRSNYTLPRKAKKDCVEKLQLLFKSEYVDTFDELLNFDCLSFDLMGIELNISTLPNAGFGVFASKTFQKNDVITEYTGEVIDLNDVCKRTEMNKFHYIAKLDTKLAIDGTPRKVQKKGQSLGCMLNDAKNPAKTNCYLYCGTTKTSFKNTGIRTKFRLFIVASKQIIPGQELFLNYGEKYWKKFNTFLTCQPKF